jgi:hypothetical protein
MAYISGAVELCTGMGSGPISPPPAEDATYPTSQTGSQDVAGKKTARQEERTTATPD